MANSLKKLRKENNVMDKELNKENNLIMTDMIVYLRSSNLCDYDIEIIRRELFGMVYEAQLRNEHISTVIGEDYKGFCDELMQSGRQKTLYEIILEWAYVGSAGVGILFIIEIIFSGTLFLPFKTGSFIMPITLGFILSTILTVAAAMLVYWYFTNYSFDLSSSKSLKFKLIFVLSYGIFFSTIILVKYFFNDTILFNVNFIYPTLIFAGLYIVVKILGNRNENYLARTHN